MQPADELERRYGSQVGADLQRLFGSIMGWLVSRRMSHATAEDVMQKALSELVRRASSWPATFEEFARRFRARVKYRLTDDLRKMIRERARQADPRAAAVRKETTPAEAAEREEARGRAKELFEGMAPELRDLAAVWFDGRSEADVAEELCVSRGQLRCLKARLTRALWNRAKELGMDMKALVEAL